MININTIRHEINCATCKTSLGYSNLLQTQTVVCNSCLQELKKIFPNLIPVEPNQSEILPKTQVPNTTVKARAVLSQQESVDNNNSKKPFCVYKYIVKKTNGVPYVTDYYYSCIMDVAAGEGVVSAEVLCCLLGEFQFADRDAYSQYGNCWIC